MNDDSKDIVARLRHTVGTALPSTTGFTRLSDSATQLLGEAADEIEHLRTELEAAHQSGRFATRARGQPSGASVNAWQVLDR
jgi:hypothetical protein